MGNATATFPLSTPGDAISARLRGLLGVDPTALSVRTYLSDPLTWNVELGGNTTVGGWVVAGEGVPSRRSSWRSHLIRSPASGPSLSCSVWLL